jgi:uncharacterized membrane protein YqiK
MFPVFMCLVILAFVIVFVFVFIFMERASATRVQRDLMGVIVMGSA